MVRLVNLLYHQAIFEHIFSLHYFIFDFLLLLIRNSLMTLQALRKLEFVLRPVTLGIDRLLTRMGLLH